MRPTPRPPVDTATELVNLSNLPGADLAPSVAVHPVDGWAGVIWANVPPEGDAANVFVKVQDPISRAWQPGISVNTTPARTYAAHPALAIDAEGRIHALFAQDGLRLHYRRSEDAGRSWTPPEALPTSGAHGSGMALRATVDAAGVLHVVYIAGDCGEDCFQTHHVQRPADTQPSTPWSTPERPLPGTKHLRADLVTFQQRLVVAAACPRGCGASRPVVAVRDGNGPWHERSIPGDVTHDDWEINWISAVKARDSAVCLAWSHYARSGVYSACSFDRGDTWEAAKPIVETYPLTPTGDSAFTPGLLYEPLSATLLAVQLYAQAGDDDRRPVYPVFSIRWLQADHWVPDVAGPFDHPQRSVPFRLFAAATPHSAALPREGVRVGYVGRDLALAVWVEQSPSEGLDVYSGWFHPAALLAEVR
ncbi:MAG: hypothetical protein M3R24_31610 [Chloroflexota bacterium]|nr:hypothetical protein [Chloroflexota bacterium]